jgi:hypothetical protein
MKLSGVILLSPIYMWVSFLGLTIEISGDRDPKAITCEQLVDGGQFLSNKIITARK